MRIIKTIVSTTFNQGLWTTIRFQVDSIDEISSASKTLLDDLKNRYQDIPGNIDEEMIIKIIKKMFLITNSNDIREINFQLEYRGGDKQIEVGVDWGQIPQDNHSLFHIVTDSNGNFYKEIIMTNNEKIRVTLVKDSWNGDNGIRIQIREPNGHLRQGPEIPSEYVDDLIRGLKGLKNYGK